MASRVIFAETGLGPVVIKRARGNRVEALRRESFVFNSLKGIELTIPEVLLLVESPQAEECWLVIRRLPGEPLEFFLQSKEMVSVHPQLIFDLGKTISQLHGTPYPPHLYNQGVNWLDAMFKQANDNLMKGIGEGSIELLERLTKTQPDPVDPVLIHGDLFLDNVLSNGFEITGMIDWAFGAVGDPRYDIALATYGFSKQDKKTFFEGYGKSIPIGKKDYDYYQRLALFY